MARKIDIREDVYGRLVRKKEQKKIRYDKGVKTQYFTRGDLELLKDSTPHSGKLTERWRGPLLSTALVEIIARHMYQRHLMENRHLIRIVVITYVYSAFEKDICAPLIRRCLKLHLTFALEQRKIEVLQVRFHVYYVQFLPPCYHFLHNRAHLPALSQSMFDSAGGSRSFRGGTVEEKG